MWRARTAPPCVLQRFVWIHWHRVSHHRDSICGAREEGRRRHRGRTDRMRSDSFSGTPSEIAVLKHTSLGEGAGLSLYPLLANSALSSSAVLTLTLTLLLLVRLAAARRIRGTPPLLRWCGVRVWWLAVGSILSVRSQTPPAPARSELRIANCEVRGYGFCLRRLHVVRLRVRACSRRRLPRSNVARPRSSATHGAALIWSWCILHGVPQRK